MTFGGADEPRPTLLMVFVGSSRSRSATEGELADSLPSPDDSPEVAIVKAVVSTSIYARGRYTALWLTLRRMHSVPRAAPTPTMRGLRSSTSPPSSILLNPLRPLRVLLLLSSANSLTSRTMPPGHTCSIMQSCYYASSPTTLGPPLLVTLPSPSSFPP